MSPRILLFGKAGQVAWELRRTLAPMSELTCAGQPDVDFTKPESLRQAIRAASPDVIINPAAYTAVDKAESEKERARQINAEAPALIAEEAKKLGALLVHYSTDYVFDGTKTTPYVETDRTNPLGHYGHTKLAGEQAVQQSGCNHLILRLCWVYGNRGANFLRTIQRVAREREVLRVVADQFGSPTSARMIAEATALLLRQVPTPDLVPPLSGVYHLSCAGQTSWHAFASAIVQGIPEVERKCREVQAITTAEWPTPTKRPAYSVLSTDKLHDTFGLRLPDWRHALDLVLEN